MTTQKTNKSFILSILACIYLSAVGAPIIFAQDQEPASLSDEDHKKLYNKFHESLDLYKKNSQELASEKNAELVAQTKVVTATTAPPNTKLQEKITIFGKDLYVKEPQGDAQRGFIAEYIPKDATWDNWDLMYAIRFNPGKNLDIEKSILATAEVIKQRKAAGDQIANQQVFKKDANTFAIDFILSENNAKMIEHNVWAYIKVRQGVLRYQIARRVYAEKNTDAEMNKFIAEIPSIRSELVSATSARLINPPFDVD